MKSVGIDTVILIRAGYNERVTFNSKVLRKHLPIVRPCHCDYVDLFLTEAERCDMSFYFGTYDGGQWHDHDVQREIDINKEFCREVADTYGHRKAFAGWYLTYEIDSYDSDHMKLYRELGRHVRNLADLPVLMSPYVKGRMQFDDPIGLEDHTEQWDRIFAAISDFVDIVAFQDGQMHLTELADFMRVNCNLARKHGIIPWSSIETFERGMPMDFLPINWDNMFYKLNVTDSFPVEKLITFEFSHFLSPNSMYPSAHQLFKRYCDYLQSGRP